MYLSSDARMNDIRALIDSYAVVLLDRGRVRIEWPIQICGLGVQGLDAVESVTAKDARWPLPHVAPFHVFPLIDPELDLRMVQWVPPPDSCRVERETRWPFYVDHPLQVMFVVGEQWWRFDFTPGTTYEERRLKGAPGQLNPSGN